jgi:hypothetical protein
MSLQTDALDAVALAATNQTIAANSLKDASEALRTDYAATKNIVDTELNLVDNIADIDKVVSTATANELATKQPTLVDGDNISTVNGVSLLSGSPLVIARGRVEIPTLVYESRASLRSPVTPLPLAGDVVNIKTLGHFQYSTLFEFVEDDETVFQAVNPSDGVTPIGQWVMALPSYEWTESQKMFERAVLDEWIEDAEIRHNNFAADHNSHE